MLHQHSTLFGLSATAAVVAGAGYVSHWTVFVMVVAAFAGLYFFPRLFYGWDAYRELGKAPFVPGGVHSGRGVWFAEPTASERLMHAYEEARGGATGAPDDTKLRQLAQEERS